MTFRFLGLNGVRYLKNKVMQMINSAISSVTPSSIGAVPTSASCNKNWYWSGQGGQPSWLWGGNNANDCYVYNPSNFSVNYANSAGNANTLDNLDSTAFCKSNDARLSNARPTEIKELWRGTLTSGGTITVPGISPY
ncbi:MAG: hypothetical protein RSC73_02885, partial [Ruthenibacterium sp.]